MKKILCFVSALLIGVSAMAVPAKRGVITTYTQPDGTVVRVQLHGDEYLSWYTLAGTSQMVARHDDGFWRPSSISPALRAAAQERRRQDKAERELKRAKMKSTYSISHGEHHIPVLLVEFQDVKFKQSNPLQAFDDMLNKIGYRQGNAKGSIRDFFRDNSFDEYKPVFDVYGPVTLPHDMAYYGEQIMNGDQVVAHDRQAYRALIDGAKALDANVDFSIYDEDHDGYVDMTLFYYAGYSQAESGPTDAIWPHQSNVGGFRVKLDGVMLGQYFCTAELRGNTGSTICGIGVTAHEFSHSLGLPDYYDTDYKDNGETHGMYYFDIMSDGCYLKGGDIPPYFTALERVQLGWFELDDLPLLTQGFHTLEGVQNNKAFMISSATQGESYIVECRTAQGWDSELPAGMIAYHIDRSSEHKISSRYTAEDLWEENMINAFSSHPCCIVIPAGDQSNVNCSKSWNTWVFPGSKNVNTFIAKDWAGNELATLSSISCVNGVVSFKATVTGAVNDTPFGKLGITAIYDPGNGSYSVGDDFILQLDMPDDAELLSVLWSYDGASVNGSVSNLTAGTHIVRAVVKWADESTESFELEIHVQ